MRLVALRELKINPSKVIARLRRGPLVVTRNGKPAAALVRLDENLLDPFILLHHPAFAKEVERARAEFRRKGAVVHARRLQRLKRRLGSQMSIDLAALIGGRRGNR